MPLKLVLISPEGTVGAHGKAEIEIVDQLATFVRRMYDNNVHVALWSRHQKTINNEPVEKYLSRKSGAPVRFFLAAHDGLPDRQYKGSVNPILGELGIERHEAILVGNRQADLRAGVNNKLLLIRPQWYTEEINYGFEVSSISSLARFCEIFALRQHPIYWSIDDGTLRVRAMGPFSTLIPDFALFGADAKQVAKEDGGERQFWFYMIVSTLYFSALVQEVDYICAFPGHNPKSKSEVSKGLDSLMTIFGKCFQKPYLKDFIIRHAKSIKSQTAKPHEKTFCNQLNSVYLNSRPVQYDRAEPMASAIRLKNKTVLVIDDICTNGRSLDSARAYIEAAGGQTVLFSWLKTISSPFLHMLPDPYLTPFKPNIVPGEPKFVSYGYKDHIVDHSAPVEISQVFSAFKDWKWP